MIRLSNQELDEFILSFKRELKCHWKDNTLNQLYGYEIIQDLPPYCMYLDWNNKSYLFKCKQLIIFYELNIVSF